MKLKLSTLFLALSVTTSFATQATAFECNGHVKVGTPSESSDQLLCRDGYAAGYNYTTKNSDWVAYHITKESVNAKQKRSNRFKEDKELPEDARSTLADYRSSGYDRGHLAPSAAMDFTYESMLQSFLLSNMSPQLPGFNRNGWRLLEEHVRDLANTYNELYVVTGPIYDNYNTTIGNGVTVPTSFYKVVLDPAYNEAIAYIVPHRDISGAELPQFIVSVDEVEQKTGLDFFNMIDDSIEEKMEAEVWEEHWPVN